LGGFESFDLTNPRGRFDGERFHLACPKLGLGDAILSHTILAQFYISAGGFYIATGTGREGGRTIGAFQQGGAHHPWREIRCRRLVRKKGEEGFYLYLKRQSEGTWMNSKCQIPSK
jgi:hypothetical protein